MLATTNITCKPRIHEHIHVPLVSIYQHRNLHIHVESAVCYSTISTCGSITLNFSDKLKCLNFNLKFPCWYILTYSLKMNNGGYLLQLCKFHHYSLVLITVNYYLGHRRHVFLYLSSLVFLQISLIPLHLHPQLPRSHCQ